MEIDYTNEVMMNHYKKQELIKAKKRLDEKMSKTDILKLADKRFITEDEIKEALGFDFIEDEITNIGEISNGYKFSHSNVLYVLQLLQNHRIKYFSFQNRQCL